LTPIFQTACAGAFARATGATSDLRSARPVGRSQIERPDHTTIPRYRNAEKTARMKMTSETDAL
ncbi:MAG: hypothetical protein ABIS14_08785, partial [Sphingomonas sp.]